MPLKTMREILVSNLAMGLCFTVAFPVYPMPDGEKPSQPTWSRHLQHFFTNESNREITFASIENFQIGFMHAGDQAMQAGSISKVIASTAALILFKNNRISPAHFVTDYSKNYFEHIECPFQDITWNNQITFEHLFSHRSGLGEDVLGQNRCLAFSPGSKFFYSGAGFHLLQNAMEEIAQSSLEEIARKEIFSRLGLKNSTFILQAFDQQFENAAFSLVSTAQDLAKFFIELASPKILDVDSINLLKTQIHSLTQRLDWGSSIGIYKCGSDRVLWHWGSNMGRYHSLVFITEQGGTGAVLMTEGEKESSLKFLKETANSILPCPDYLFWDDVIQ